jgi:WD40 repeat protein
MYRRKSRSIFWLALIISFLGITVETAMMQNVVPPFFVPPQWSFDSDQMAMVEGSTLLIYDVASNVLLHRLEGHTDTINSVSWSPIDHRLASASADQTVKVWDGITGTLIYNFTEHNEFVGLVRWSPNGSHLITSETGVDIRSRLLVWNAQTGVVDLSTEAGRISQAVFSPDGNFLALNHSLSLSVFDGENFQRIIRKPPALCCANRMETLAWSSDSSQLITGSINGLITIWDAATLTQINQFAIDPSYPIDPLRVSDEVLSRYWIRDVAFGIDGMIEAVSGNGTVSRWDAEGNLLQVTQIGQLETASWSAYGAQLAVQRETTSSALSIENELQTDAEEILQIVTPFASLDRFQAIAAACGADQLVGESVTDAALPAVITDLQTMTDEQIPPACAADLIAIAQTLIDPQ